MAAYNYKYIRDRVPEFITDNIQGYEGTCDYDGDLWLAAADYIDALETEIAQQHQLTHKVHNKELEQWLTDPERDGKDYGSVRPIIPKV